MLVSVYITTFNRIELLKRAIESVQQQTYQNIELIVADDGSTDGTQAFLTDLEKQGKLICILNQGAAKGACVGRNKALELAQGKFITGLDDDDYFEAWRVEKFVEIWLSLEAHQSNIAGLFDNVVEHRHDGAFRCTRASKVSYQELRTQNAIGNQIFTLTDYLKEIAGFDEAMPALQDWDTWLRLAKQKGTFINIKSYSYIIIQDHGAGRISEKPADKIRTAFERLTSKLGPLSAKESAQLTYVMYGYKQLDNKLEELVRLFMFGYWRRIAQVIKRTYFAKA